MNLRKDISVSFSYPRKDRKVYKAGLLRFQRKECLLNDAVFFSCFMKGCVPGWSTKTHSILVAKKSFVLEICKPIYTWHYLALKDVRTIVFDFAAHPEIVVFCKCFDFEPRNSNSLRCLRLKFYGGSHVRLYIYKLIWY